MSHKYAKRGFGMLDALFVLAGLGMVGALTLPALQDARETSRQAQCLLNLQKLGLAHHSHHDTHNRLPPMRLGTWVDGAEGPTKSNLMSMSGLVYLTPFLESSHVFDDARVRNFGPVPWRIEPRTWSVNIHPLICPSDEVNLDAPTGNSSYKFSVGTTVTGNHSQWYLRNGLAGVHGRTRRQTIRIRDVKDGTSNTWLMSERRIGNRKDKTDFANVAINVAAAHSDDPEVAFAACWKTANQEAKRYNPGQAIATAALPGERWADGRPYFAGFTTVVTPNGPSCLIDGTHGGAGVFTASSRHPGLVNVLRVDGSVAQCSDTIDKTVWWKFGTRAGRDPVAGEDRLAITRGPKMSALTRKLMAFNKQDPFTRHENESGMTAEQDQAEVKQVLKDDEDPFAAAR